MKGATDSEEAFSHRVSFDTYEPEECHELGVRQHKELFLGHGDESHLKVGAPDVSHLDLSSKQDGIFLLRSEGAEVLVHHFDIGAHFFQLGRRKFVRGALQHAKAHFLECNSDTAVLHGLSLFGKKLRRNLLGEFGTLPLEFQQLAPIIAFSGSFSLDQLRYKCEALFLVELFELLVLRDQDFILLLRPLVLLLNWRFFSLHLDGS